MPGLRHPLRDTLDVIALGRFKTRQDTRQQSLVPFQRQSLVHRVGQKFREGVLGWCGTGQSWNTSRCSRRPHVPFRRHQGDALIQGDPVLPRGETGIADVDVTCAVIVRVAGVADVVEDRARISRIRATPANSNRMIPRRGYPVSWHCESCVHRRFQVRPKLLLLGRGGWVLLQPHRFPLSVVRLLIQSISQQPDMVRTVFGSPHHVR